MSKLQQLSTLLRKPLPEDFYWHFVSVYCTDEYTLFGVRHSTNLHHIRACGDAIGLGIHVGLLPPLESPYAFEYKPNIAEQFDITQDDVDNLFFVPIYIPLPNSLDMVGYRPEQVADGIDRFISGQQPVRTP